MSIEFNGVSGNRGTSRLHRSARTGRLRSPEHSARVRSATDSLKTERGSRWLQAYSSSFGEMQPYLPAVDATHRKWSSVGDPHITMGKEHFEDQKVGTFTVLQSADGGFAVQAHQSNPPGNKDVTLNTGVAIQDGLDIVSYDSLSKTLVVNGEEWDGSADLPGGGRIAKSGDGFTITSSRGDITRIHDRGTYLDLDGEIAADREVGEIRGGYGAFDNVDDATSHVRRDGRQAGSTDEMIDDWKTAAWEDLFQQQMALHGGRGGLAITGGSPPEAGPVPPPDVPAPVLPVPPAAPLAPPASDSTGILAGLTRMLQQLTAMLADLGSFLARIGGGAPVQPPVQPPAPPAPPADPHAAMRREVHDLIHKAQDDLRAGMPRNRGPRGGLSPEDFMPKILAPAERIRQLDVLDRVVHQASLAPVHLQFLKDRVANYGRPGGLSLDYVDALAVDLALRGRHNGGPVGTDTLPAAASAQITASSTVEFEQEALRKNLTRKAVEVRAGRLPEAEYRALEQETAVRLDLLRQTKLLLLSYELPADVSTQIRSAARALAIRPDLGAVSADYTRFLRGIRDRAEREGKELLDIPFILVG